MSRHFDNDLSDDYTQPFRDKLWLQQTIQVQTAEGPAENKAYKRFGGLIEDSSHKLGQRARLTVLSAMGQGAAIRIGPDMLNSGVRWAASS